MKTDSLDRCGCGKPAQSFIGKYFVTDSMCQGCYDYESMAIHQGLANGELIVCDDCKTIHPECLTCPRCQD
jgi:hypothetical protein